MDQRIPIKVNTQLNERTARLDSPHQSQSSSSSSDIRDKMQQRMREFEEESRRWREQFMSNSASASSPLASMDAYSRPRMLVNAFPEFPEMNWTSPSHGVTSIGRSGGSSLFSSAVNSSSTSSQNNSHKSFIEEDNDGNKKYKLQFDIGDFKPNEIQVRTEGRMLIVKGGHEIHAGTATESKQFNRELTLPEFVEPTTVTSYLCDGILTVDAPVIMDRLSINAAGQQQNTIQSSMSNNNSRRSPFRDQISPPRGTLLTTINTNSPNNSISSSNQMAINALSSSNNSSLINSSTMPTYRFNLSEFRPEDISITVTDTTLNIHAVREEMEPRGKTYREFKRELGLPPNADVKRLKNSLQPDGILVIEIPVHPEPQQQQQQQRVSQQGLLNKQFNQMSLDHQQQAAINERVNIDNTELKITFDLTGYRPEDVNIKCIGNTLKVHAVHIDNSKGNQIHREYSRSYILPDWVNSDLLRARMSDNGMLTVEVPLPQVQPPQLERLIKIQQF